MVLGGNRKCKLAVVPGLCTVVNAQELDESVIIRLAYYHRKPLPKRKSFQPSLTHSSGLRNLSSGGKLEKSREQTNHGTAKCTALVGRYGKANTMTESSWSFPC